MFKPKIIVVTRILLGIILLVFGINKFLMFLPPFELNGNADAFFNALINSGYIFPVIGLIEALTGISMLTNRYVPLSLLIMAPITISFMLFHLFLDLSPNIGAGLVVFALQLFLMFAYIDLYRPLLKPNSQKLV